MIYDNVRSFKLFIDYHFPNIIPE